MKKTILFSILACAILSPTVMLAQKKGKSKPTKVKEVATSQILNDSDSTAYIFGMAMSQGLDQYLMQSGTLADTSSMTAYYNIQLENETDANKKAAILKEKAAKMDSVVAANAASMKEFIAGFRQSFFSENSRAAFNTGISIAEQVKKSTEAFSKEMLASPNDFKNDIFGAAFLGTLEGQKPLLDIEKPQEKLQEIAEKMQKRKAKEAEEALKDQYKDEVAAGEKFLADNKAKEGVVTLPSGLQYKVLTKGEGAIPTKTDIVKVHYKGTLIDGTQFDSSYDRGEATSFSAGHVIQGWTEALTLMPVGSKWELYIPYDLAYGARDQGVIKPFSTLVFEVELLGMTSAEDMESQMQEIGEE